MKRTSENPNVDTVGDTGLAPSFHPGIQTAAVACLDPGAEAVGEVTGSSGWWGLLAPVQPRCLVLRQRDGGECGLEPGVFGKSLPGVLEAFPPSTASSRSSGRIGCNTSRQEQAATWTPRSLSSHPSESQGSREPIPEAAGASARWGEEAGGSSDLAQPS